MNRISFNSILRKITVLCSVCGKKMTIELYRNGKYKGGHYFGKINAQKEEVEYWECDKCYKG